MKKAITFALVIAMLIIPMPSAFAEPVVTFEDVPADAWYYNPVMWAVEKGITAGSSATTFSPDDTCTRAQVVTFLWRFAGQPDPKSTANPFKDVKGDAYYYKAVLWAVEKGITSGVSSDEFAPDDPCTRGQVVTFMHRHAGNRLPDISFNPFDDVKESDFFYKPVLWAVGRKITAGTSMTTFGPNDECTRSQIVTFLYRYPVYSVTLDPNQPEGFSRPSVIYVSNGQPYGELKEPTLQGYAFVGWFTEPTGGVEITPDTIVNLTGSQRLYGQWVKTGEKYTVYFYPNTGEEFERATGQMSVMNGANYGTLPAAPVREGYRFKGWFTDRENGKEIRTDSAVLLTGNQSLYAHWVLDLGDAPHYGQHIMFGQYRIDTDETNGFEPIEWVVVKIEDDRVLLKSLYVLDNLQFHKTKNNLVYANSDLRAWLNGPFMKMAFYGDDLRMISPEKTIVPKNRLYDSKQGSFTGDLIRLVEYGEKESMYEKGVPTPYAVKMGVKMSDHYKDDHGEYTCTYWTCTMGEDNMHAVTVGPDGVFYARGEQVNTNGIGVRPEIWIKR